ncbi:MAG: sensor histidine kinase [Arenimonas sp.]
MASAPRVGLRRTIWVAFLLQATALAVAAVLGVYGASLVVKRVLIQQALKEEAAHLWSRLESNPAAEVPDTANLVGHLLTVGADRRALPAELRDLSPGFHVLPRSQGGALVEVEERNGHRLFLLFKPEKVDALAFWFGVAPLAVVMVLVFLLAWASYRVSRRAVTPVIWLAEQVKLWHPDHPEVDAIRPEALPPYTGQEARELAAALHDFGSRLGRFVERERNFTRDASHELRTPLTVMRVATDMIVAEPGLSPMAQRALRRVQGANRDMEALVESFLILAREGDTGLPGEHFPVSDVVRDEIEKVRPMLAGKAVELRVEQGADFELHAPSTVLAVMLGNLLRNACRYTDAGHVIVRVDAGRIEIDDTGIGMGPEELSRAFEPFYRGAVGQTGGREVGQGIGLTIVQRLADRYRWPVKIESELGRGTHAQIRFPDAVPLG